MRKFDGKDTTHSIQANPGYALERLARAYATRDSHVNPDVRERAGGMAAAWKNILGGMASGFLTIGSREPVANMPAWATLVVAQGGFATGIPVAGGRLLPHEKEILGRIPSSPASRVSINNYYVTDDGLRELQELLASGCYRIDTPEEGALLAVAWLLANNHDAAALDILDEIAPYFDTLRFYPMPASAPSMVRSQFYLQTVGQTLTILNAVRERTSVVIQREAMVVWTPLVDRMVDLFLQTVQGDAPSLKTGDDGKPLRDGSARYVVEGGWPCQYYADDWNERARKVLDEFTEARKHHQRYQKIDRKGENIFILRRCLELCVQDAKQLTGRDVGMIRLVVAGFVTRRGTPKSEECRRLREYQTKLARLPSNPELARLVAARLATAARDEPLESVGEILAPVTAAESVTYGMPVNHDVAGRMRRKVLRCVAAPLDVLVEKRVITSGDVLAKVAPQLTARVRTAGFHDPALSRLYQQIYGAFRRRRSLLLLNLESQVKLRELPWVYALDKLRAPGEDTEQLARRALTQVATLAVTAFPQQIPPNKLLQEMRALADDAGLQIPIVDELAADIFMGAFGEKFLRSAQLAGDLLENTLYERYYGVRYDQVRRINDVAPRGSRNKTPTSPAFFALCRELAGTYEGRSPVVKNGIIIEQQQILTTHNLAVLFTSLGLEDSLRPQLSDLAKACFLWICARNRQTPPGWKQNLRVLKNSAYAWRQMIFFLALLPREAVVEFHAWASGHLAAQCPEFQTRFAPAMLGLERAIAGLPTETPAHHDGVVGARKFLGWTAGNHWVL